MENNKISKVVTSCRSRFWIFDQARELNKHGLLLKLIADYPKSYPRSFGIPSEKVEHLVFTGFFNHGFTRFRKFFNDGTSSYIDRYIHNSYSKKLKRYISDDTQFFIGLSSFSLEALEHCKNQKIMCAVDHGSLHQLEERTLLQDEAKHWGLPHPDNTTPDWIIKKENEEFKAADYIFLPSSAAKESFIKHGIPEDKIFINPYGVNLSTFKPGQKKDNVFRIVQVGNVTLRKGVLTLIEAFKLANIPNSELVFIGPMLDSPEFVKKIDALKADNIKFQGAVPQNELHKHFAQASVSCLASIADGFALVVVQSMACGIPAIVTENVGSKDIIQNGENGYVVPIRSPDILAKRLQYLAENPDKLKEMSGKALQTISESCSWESYGKRLRNFINSLGKTTPSKNDTLNFSDQN